MTNKATEQWLGILNRTMRNKDGTKEIFPNFDYSTVVFSHLTFPSRPFFFLSFLEIRKFLQNATSFPFNPLDVRLHRLKNCCPKRCQQI